MTLNDTFSIISDSTSQALSENTAISVELTSSVWTEAFNKFINVRAGRREADWEQWCEATFEPEHGKTCEDIDV